jgi:hypothetical protein
LEGPDAARARLSVDVTTDHSTKVGKRRQITEQYIGSNDVSREEGQKLLLWRGQAGQDAVHVGKAGDDAGHWVVGMNFVFEIRETLVADCG